ncbi:hypothetical protein EX30DRAFT_161708 [Ascodesmis nigricans]|uniref:Uncharacterized protein n=1 Tax=Ascodesmis nigricans TaxID=341454 RepID=A0A4S2MMH7_9PEZI|nr:hypothetical protein EX30DRAFT_161708 [Ascodesmis nigricans]
MPQSNRILKVRRQTDFTFPDLCLTTVKSHDQPRHSTPTPPAHSSESKLPSPPPPPPRSPILSSRSPPPGPPTLPPPILNRIVPPEISPSSFRLAKTAATQQLRLQV